MPVPIKITIHLLSSTPSSSESTNFPIRMFQVLVKITSELLLMATTPITGSPNITWQLSDTVPGACHVQRDSYTTHKNHLYRAMSTRDLPSSSFKMPSLMLQIRFFQWQSFSVAGLTWSSRYHWIGTWFKREISGYWNFFMIAISSNLSTWHLESSSAQLPSISEAVCLFQCCASQVTVKEVIDCQNLTMTLTVFPYRVDIIA